MLTRYGTKKIVRILIFSIIILIVVGYGFYTSYDFIIGPVITISEPQNGSSFSDPTVRIKGVVKRIQEITLNDRPITIDDKGNFNETVLLAPGHNVFELRAGDKFGRSKEVRLELVYRVN